DGQAGVAQARARLAKARPRQLRPCPQRVVVLHEPQLDAVVAEPAGGFEDRGQAPSRAAQGREAELHVILASMAGRTRLRTGRPRKKRSRSSSSASAMALRTSRCAAPTW